MARKTDTPFCPTSLIYNDLHGCSFAMAPFLELEIKKINYDFSMHHRPCANHFLNSLFSNFAIFLIPAAGFIRDRPFYEPGFQRGFQIILSEGRPV